MAKPSPSTVALVGILIGSITLLQIHAISFWQQYVGTIGFAWSILLEATALWLWYQPRMAYRTLALLASVLVLLGPIHHVSEPLIEELTVSAPRESARLARIESLREERTLVVESLQTFRQNSRERSGWLPAIQDGQDRLQEIDAELAKLLATPPPDSQALRDKAVVVMQVLALVIFQITAVLAITTLSRLNRQSNATSRRPDQVKEGGKAAAHIVPAVVRGAAAAERPKTNGAAGRQDVAGVRDALDAYLRRENMTQQAFSRQHGFPARDLSFLRRHEERVERGERTISEPSLARLAEILSRCG